MRNKRVASVIVVLAAIGLTSVGCRCYSSRSARLFQLWPNFVYLIAELLTGNIRRYVHLEKWIFYYNEFLRIPPSMSCSQVARSRIATHPM